MSDAPESLSEALLAARNPAGVFERATELFQAMMPPAHDITSNDNYLSNKRGPFACGSNDVFQLEDDQDTLGENMLAMTLCAALSEPLLSQQYSDLGRASTVSSSPTNSFSVIEPRSCFSASALGSTQFNSPLTAGGALPAAWSAQGSSPEGRSGALAAAAGSVELSSAGLGQMLRSSSACLPSAHRHKRRAVRASDSMMQLDDLLPPITLPQQQQQQQLQQQQSMQLQDQNSGVLSHTTAEFLKPRSKMGRKLLQQQQDALAAEALQMEQQLDMEIDCVQHELQKLRQRKQQQGLSQRQRMRSTQGSADLSDLIMREVNLLGEDSLMRTQQQQQQPQQLPQADMWASNVELTDYNSQQQQQQQVLAQPAWDMQHDYSGAMAGYEEPVAQELPPRKRGHHGAAPFNGLALRAMSDPLMAQRLQQKQQRQQLRLPTAAAAEQGALLQMLLQKRLHRQKQQQQQEQGVQVDQAVTLQRLQNALRRCASRNALNEGAVAGF